MVRSVLPPVMRLIWTHARIYVAPLALRAAKQAISRVPDIGFESGKPCAAQSRPQRLM